MTAVRTYLDHNATAPLRPEARAAMLRALELTGNASSVHAEGRRARAMVETAREQVARLVGARPSEVLFTSGATEANNWVLSWGWRTVAAAGLEHDSILVPARRSGARVIEVPALSDGRADVTALRACLAAQPLEMPALVTLQMANNETGVLQPLADAAAVAREFGAKVHSDAVQAAGRIRVDMRELAADAALSLSSHKLGGPMGAGALVVRDGLGVRPLITGGGQERRLRAGTENVPAIAGFGAAAEAAYAELDRMERIAALRDRLEREALRMAPEAIVIGQEAPRLANTTCLALPKHSAELLVIKLDLAGIAVSAGSACSSGKVGVSAALAAMGLPAEVARAAIRISLGWNSSQKDVDAFLRAWGDIVRGAERRAVA
jgi:cysteine desulfurase